MKKKKATLKKKWQNKLLEKILSAICNKFYARNRDLLLQEIAQGLEKSVSGEFTYL